MIRQRKLKIGGAKQWLQKGKGVLAPIPPELSAPYETWVADDVKPSGRDGQVTEVP